MEAKIRKLHGDLCARVEQLATDLGRHAQLRNAVSLGRAPAKQGDVAQASEHAMALVPEVFEFQSARVQRRLHTLYVQLKDKPAIPQARDFSDAYDEAVARMAGNP